MTSTNFDLEWKLGVRVRFQLEFRDQKINRLYSTVQNFESEFQNLLGLQRPAVDPARINEIVERNPIVNSTYHEPIATELVFYVKEYPIPYRKYHKVVTRTLLSDKMHDRDILDNKPLLPRNVLLIISKRRLKYPLNSPI
jgi:hypothetical protein